MFEVGNKSKKHDKLMIQWLLPQSLMGGTLTMRENHKEFLPQWPSESDKHYAARTNSSNLFNAFKRTVRVLSAKPFSEEVKVVEIPPDLEVVADDVDRNGLTITQFAHSQLADKLTFGLQVFLVDMPSFKAPISKAAALQDNIHPYFCRVDPTTIVYDGWEADATGKSTLVELHIMTCESDRQDIDWYVVTVWDPGMVTKYRKRCDSNSQEKFVVYEEHTNELGYIPLVVSYALTSKTGDLAAQCPLEDLAHLNLRHYQSQSDQDTSLHYARVPFLHFAGFDKAEVEKIIAANNAFVSKNPAAAIKWVEPTGGALNAGSKDLEALENRMDVMGADLLVQKPGNPTATAKAIDTAEKMSDLQSMVVSLGQALEQGYRIASDWMGIMDPAIEVKLNTDFGLSLNDVGELNFLLQSRLAGEISQDLFYAEIQRRGLFDQFDPEEEKNRLALEFKNTTPPAGSISKITLKQQQPPAK